MGGVRPGSFCYRETIIVRSSEVVEGKAINRMLIICIAAGRRRVQPQHGEVTMCFRRELKFALCAMIGVLSAALTIHSASAWTWTQYVTVFTGPGLCVQGKAGIDHFQSGVFSGNLAYSGTYARDQGCGNGLNGQWAATRLDVWKWTGSAWAICNGTNWKFDYTGSDQFGPLGPGWVFSYGGSASCGSGYYGTFASAYVWDGSAWRGGMVWSGYEFVP
jgi:hypothetical protein